MSDGFFTMLMVYYLIRSFRKYFCSLYRPIIILYLVCFGCYLLFTRQPDYLDGEKAPAVIRWSYDSAAHRSIPKAVFSNGLKNYAIDARYIFREWKDGDRLEVIYETGTPEKAAVYGIWGYWISVGELLASIILAVALYLVAMTVTRNPTPEAVMDQLELKEEKKRKYLE